MAPIEVLQRESTNMTPIQKVAVIVDDYGAVEEDVGRDHDDDEGDTW